MPSPQLILALLIPLAYFIGAVPFGLVVGLAKGIDPRKSGSGNIGATNLGRLLGGRYFALVFTLDLLKSLIPMVVAGIIVHHAAAGYDWKTYLLWLLVGFAAIVGHMFPVYLRFKGGKGVATSAGVILGLYPFYTWPAIAAILVWIVVFLIWRYVSLASILGSLSFPIAYIILAAILRWPMLSQQVPLLVFAALVAALITLKHRSNISRLLAGTEHGFRKSQEATE